MKMTTMGHKETLHAPDIKDFLMQACKEKAQVVGSYLCGGKWRLLEMDVCGFSDDFIAFYAEGPCEYLKKELPVGICIHSGYYKYLFDTKVQAIEKQDNITRVLLDFPDKTERVQRRMYDREGVPGNLKVKVLFWHRGYLSDSNHTPKELYWQGRMLNLSAGGAQFEIDPSQKEHFSVGQLLGVQFTPMSYQKPFLLESHVRYLREQPDHSFRIGVEFLGLEASPEGREVLSRLIEVISEYHTMNSTEEPNDNHS